MLANNTSIYKEICVWSSDSLRIALHETEKNEIMAWKLQIFISLKG